ncbi:SEC10/PgrA surface exclusion domain-containing protein [Limosilactobacillus vaginalis]|uniref:SEC10/PgrA surface exclusion domain-containing protein n=1 Tax=Limosilactobacillus vaginalis TaxID=1633 RepID=UPI0024B8CFD3|nr:SEC10/PgrA surface exclusion domain-containing protein [Limosilactobacillus vaginalis]
MSNTKKILQTVALAGAVTATGAVATTAHADTTVPAASDQATTDAQSQLNNLKSQQQASEAAMAQDNQNQMSAATSAANAKIADLNNQMSANNAKQAAADSEALASGTAQINQAAQSATNAENASYSQAVASQQAANSQALTEASKHIVTPAQKQAQTSAENASYQTAVNDAQAAHNAANAQLKADYDAANQKINDQITTIQNRQTADQQQELTEATATVDRQINDAAKTAQDATAKVNTDQENVSSAQTTANTAQSDYNQAVQKLNDAKNSQSGTKQQLNTDYPQYVVMKAPDGGYNIGLTTDSWNDTDPVDQATKLHFDANGILSEEDQNIANVFAANIINHMRQQIGTPLVKVSAEGNAMQNRLMDLDHQLTGATWMDLHHTVEATQQLMNSGAIITRAENAAMSSGEGGEDDGVPTVADLKNEIYDSISRWISEEGNVDPNQPFGHRYILLGVNGYGVDNPTVALTTRVHGNGVYCTFLDVYDLPGTQHYVSLENNGLPTDPSTPTVDLNALQANVNTAKNKLDQANAALKAAQSQLATDQAAAKTAADKLNQLKEGRDQAIKDLAGSAASVQDQISALQKQASDLANDYTAKVKAENDQYNQKLASLKADHEKKLDAIKNQPSDVNALKAQLDAKLTDLKTKHEAALAKIQADAQAKIESLKQQLATNDTKANQPILDQIAQIKADLAKKQKTLDDQLAALKASDADAYTALHDKLFPKNTDVVNGKSNHMTTDDGHEIVLPGNVNQVSHTIEAKANESGESRLPQTGSSSSIVAIALGTFAAMLGLGLAKKHEF